MNDHTTTPSVTPAASEQFRRVKRWYKIGLIFVLLALLTWVVASIGLSMGSQVLEDIQRNQRIPKKPMMELESQAKAQDALERIRGFYREFVRHSERVYRTMAKDMPLAKERWNTWYAGWRSSYTLMGERYGFVHEVPEPSAYYLQLRKVYWDVEQDARQYNEHLQALFSMQLAEIPAYRAILERTTISVPSPAPPGPKP